MVDRVGSEDDDCGGAVIIRGTGGVAISADSGGYSSRGGRPPGSGRGDRAEGVTFSGAPPAARAGGIGGSGASGGGEVSDGPPPEVLEPEGRNDEEERDLTREFGRGWAGVFDGRRAGGLPYACEEEDTCWSCEGLRPVWSLSSS